MGWSLQTDEAYLKLITSLKIFPSDFFSRLLSEFSILKSHFQCFFCFHIKKYQGVIFYDIDFKKKEKLQDLQLDHNKWWHWTNWRTFIVCYLSLIGLVKRDTATLLLKKESYNRSGWSLSSSSTALSANAHGDVHHSVSRGNAALPMEPVAKLQLSL